MAGNFHGGQVTFHKYQPGWQAPFPQSQADHCYGQVIDNFGLVTLKSYKPDRLVPEKIKIQHDKNSQFLVPSVYYFFSFFSKQFNSDSNFIFQRKKVYSV